MASPTFLTFNPTNKDGAQLDEICEDRLTCSLASACCSLSSASPPASIGCTTLPSSATLPQMLPANSSSSSCAPAPSSFCSSSPSPSSLDISTSLPLQDCWHIWEQVVPEARNYSCQDYSENTKALAKFDTVQKFWQLWYHMPQPSELLNHKRMVREGQDGVQHFVDALMIFKEGIKPMWEDPCNCNGGHFEYRLRHGQIVTGSQIDEYWNNLVLGLVGGTIEYSSLITGVRLVDKLSNARGGCIRIEVWFAYCDNERTVEDLWKSVDRCMATKLDGSQGVIPKSDKKMHSVHK